MSIVTRRARARRRHVPMAGFVDDISYMIESKLGVAKPTPSAECLASANQQTAGLDAKISDLSKNWNPTGFYTPDQITGIIQNLQGMLRQASNTIDQQLAEPTAQGDRDALALSKADIARKMTDSLTFVRAAEAARQNRIGVIDSPGLKRFIVNSMLVASSAMTGASYVACMRPWFVTALSVFQIYFDAVWNVARAIVGAAVALGEKVLEIPDTISTLWSYAKWAALIAGGYYAYTRGPKLLKELTR